MSQKEESPTRDIVTIKHIIWFWFTSLAHSIDAQRSSIRHYIYILKILSDSFTNLILLFIVKHLWRIKQSNKEDAYKKSDQQFCFQYYGSPKK